MAAGKVWLRSPSRRVIGKTEMTLRHERLVNPESHDSHRHGWIGTFDSCRGCLPRVRRTETDGYEWLR